MGITASSKSYNNFDSDKRKNNTDDIPVELHIYKMNIINNLLV